MIFVWLILFPGIAIFLNATFVYTYNRFLSMMHESPIKKVVALTCLPLGSIVAVAVVLPAHFIVINEPCADGEWLTTYFALTSIMALFGVLLLTDRISRLVHQARSDWANGRATVCSPMANAWDESRLKGWQIAVLRLLRPINGVGELTVHKLDYPLPANRSGSDQSGLEGYRIVHLTDFHLHPTLRMEWFDHVITQVNALEPDLILFGGDLISKYPHVEHVALYLDKLNATDGTAFVRGNHDFWKSSQRLRNLCLKAGYQCLSNEVLDIARGDDKLSILGFESPYIPLTRAERTVMREAEGLKIGLVHTPEAYSDAAEAGCDLAFSGHTHGGQVRLPLIGTTLCGCPVRVELADGRSMIGKTKTWTSRGVGSFFPLRFRCAPEIICLTLQR